jgi:methylase of polypeptide subunit release factors
MEWATFSGAEPMTQALSAAVASAAKLPEEEQNVLAAILLEEMESEERWNALFAGSQNLLEQMANEAIQDVQAGRVQPIDELQ